jgi:hypothetical protein
MDLRRMLKMAKGNISQDEIGEIFAIAGIDADYAEIPEAETLPAFQLLGKAAMAPGAGVMRIQARMRNGQVLTGILVMNQQGNESERRLVLSA